MFRCSFHEGDEAKKSVFEVAFEKESKMAKCGVWKTVLLFARCL